MSHTKNCKNGTIASLLGVRSPNDCDDCPLLSQVMSQMWRTNVTTMGLWQWLGLFTLTCGGNLHSSRPLWCVNGWMWGLCQARTVVEPCSPSTYKSMCDNPGSRHYVSNWSYDQTFQPRWCPFRWLWLSTHIHTSANTSQMKMWNCLFMNSLLTNYMSATCSMYAGW